MGTEGEEREGKERAINWQHARMFGIMNIKELVMSIYMHTPTHIY